MKDLIIYTDGACIPNPGEGAWAYIIIENNKVIKKRAGYEPNTTNNRMEYTAFIESLKDCNENDNITLFTDSILLVDCFNKPLRKKKKYKNLDLVNQIKSIKSNYNKLNVKWVKGHSGNKGNEYVDYMCSVVIQRKY